MIQGKDHIKTNEIYSSLLNPVKNPENNKEEKAEHKSKIQDLFKSTGIKSSEEISAKDLISLYTDVPPHDDETLAALPDDSKPETEELSPDALKLKRKEEAFRVIDKTQNIIKAANIIVKMTDQKGYANLLDSSEAVLNASKGIIDLNTVKQSENKTKTVMNSISQVAGGVGTLLSVVDVPEAQFLTLTGKVIGLGVEQQDLSEKIKNKDARGVVGTSVSMAKGAWGTVVSGLSAARLLATIGHKSNVVSIKTVEKVTSKSEQISKVAGKVAIPFAVAGTALTAWDLKNDYDKVQSKKAEIEANKFKNIEISVNNKVIKRKADETETETKPEDLEKELDVLQTNTALRGASFGLSVISTSALIVSVAYPPAAGVSKVVALGGSITASITNTLASEEKRNTIVNAYESIKENYDKVLAKADDLVFGSKNKA